MALAYNFQIEKDSSCNVTLTGLFSDATTPTIPTDSSNQIVVSSVQSQKYDITELTGSRTATFYLGCEDPTLAITFSGCNFTTVFDDLNVGITTTNTSSITTTVTKTSGLTTTTLIDSSTDVSLTLASGTNTLAVGDTLKFTFTVITNCQQEFTGTYTLVMPANCVAIPGVAVAVALTENASSITYSTTSAQGVISLNQNAFGISSSSVPDTEIPDGVWNVKVTTTYKDASLNSGTFSEEHCIFTDCTLKCSMVKKSNSYLIKKEYDNSTNMFMMYDAINYGTEEECNRCNQSASIFTVLNKIINDNCSCC